MANPVWYTEAAKYVGLKEVVGPKHNQTIMGWINKMGAKILGTTVKDDETPWCGTFVAWCLTSTGFPAAPIAVRAKSWATYGRELLAPRLGCILVFDRDGGGHVGFYNGEDTTGYQVLGGNQSNSVSLTWIAKDRLVKGGMRWPTAATLPEAKPVKRTRGSQKLSTNEA